MSPAAGSSNWSAAPAASGKGGWRSSRRGAASSSPNGGRLLEPCFASVERRDYPDALAVTETAGLVDWVRSTGGMTGYTEEELDKLSAYFEGIRRRDGFIYIPKECGVFVCRA